MELAFVTSGLLGKYLDSDVISAAEVAQLLDRRGLLDGTPVCLDDETMMPLPVMCGWGNYLSTGMLAEDTMREYGRKVAALDKYLVGLGSDALSASETDLISYRSWRRRRQRKPLAARTWGKEASILDDFYSYLVKTGFLPAAPMRMAARGRNPMSPTLNVSMDIRHMTLDQYQYFRDVGLGGLLPDGQVDPAFRGWSPLRNRAASDMALGSGARWREWATVLLPELGLWPGMPGIGAGADFVVQACAKYGKPRTLYIPQDGVASADLWCVLERPAIVRAAVKTLERKAADLFVVDRVDVESGLVRGVLDGEVREFQMSAMDAQLRRITVFEGQFGLEALTVFVCRGGQMPRADSWREYRARAWRRMNALADASTPRLPTRRWRWHDLRHTYALQMLTYLENQMDGEEPDPTARRRRHETYLTGHIRHNPLLIVSRRLGHSDPATTFEYLQYTDDLLNEFEAAFRGWLGDGGATYAEIASHAQATATVPDGDR